MPGGMYDSSKTRVAPVFDQLKLRTDDWVRALLSLPQHGSGHPVGEDVNLAFVKGDWGSAERGLEPPVALLSWLIRNLEGPTKPTEINEERKRLLQREPATINRALQLVRSAGTGHAWHVFEGPTYPDAIIETPGAMVVVEGKRTEAGPTTYTTWMAGRNQIWRHMDAAWELRGGRAVFGLFVVEGTPAQPKDVPRIWVTAARDTLKQPAMDASFPHRSNLERDAIARGFLGVATWQRVCERFDIAFDALPRTTADVGPR
ncbi:MAG: hypothetical protein WCI74_20435 [Actinomycetes bacterium]